MWEMVVVVGREAGLLLCISYVMDLRKRGGIVKGPPLTASISSGNPAFARRKAQRTPERV